MVAISEPAAKPNRLGPGSIHRAADPQVSGSYQRKYEWVERRDWIYVNKELLKLNVAFKKRGLLVPANFCGSSLKEVW